MLALAFHVGKDRYALRCADIIEVVPRVDLRAIPHAPTYIAGMFTYRGAVVPVIDLSLLMWNQPTPDRMSSRIVLVEHKGRRIGLLAERMTEAVELDPQRVAEQGITVAEAPYLGEVYFTDAQAMIQLVRIDQLFARASKLLEGP